MKITFEAKPIETAPKDREIMLYAKPRGRGRWTRGSWDAQYAYKSPKPYWRYDVPTLYASEMRASAPTHWAEISEMAVTP